MRTSLGLTVMSMLLLTLAGCGSAGWLSTDGHHVSACAGAFSNVRLEGSSKGEASVTLGGKHVVVSGSQITWANGGSVALPQGWRDLQLKEKGDAIQVIVDGKQLASVHPAG